MTRYPHQVEHELARPKWVVGHFDPLGSLPGAVGFSGPVRYPVASSPSISVISPSYRHRRYLDSTLSSVAFQDFFDFEHLVVDGGSGDGTVEYLKSCVNLKWSSEPDSGYVDAFHKGLARAQGSWIIQCCISDGFLVSDWFSRCMEIFERNPHIALVWGVPRSLGGDGLIGDIAYPDLFAGPRQLDPRDTFRLWLTRGFVLPEGNMCIRREVLRELFPSVEECRDDTLDPWLEFTARFHEAGYMAIGLPVVANYGRAHSDSNTASEFNRGVWLERRRRFMRRVSKARGVHVLRGGSKIFVDWTGAPQSSTRFSTGERLESLAWSSTDVASRRLRPVLSHLPEPLRKGLRASRSRLLRSR
jgi:glycosyltransferase involved in cell wall biosynthesis